MTATGTVPVPPIRPRRVELFRPGVIARTLLTAAIVALLVYYVGFAEIGTTILKVVVAVALSMGLIVGLNLLFNMVYDRWTVFLTNVGLVIGFLTFLILDGNRVLRDLDPRPWAWAAIGGVATATVLFVQGAVRDPIPKLWLGLAGFGGLGALLAFAVADPYQPALDWTKLLVCTGIGAALGGLSGLRHRTRPAGAIGGALVGGAIGWLIGAWGGAKFGNGSIGEALLAGVIPGLAIGTGSGCQLPPTRRRGAGWRSSRERGSSSGRRC